MSYLNISEFIKVPYKENEYEVERRVVNGHQTLYFEDDIREDYNKTYKEEEKEAAYLIAKHIATTLVKKVIDGKK